MDASPDKLVRDFLRGQNLEQVGKSEDAIEVYESVIAMKFDSAGPYDRLIWLYQRQSRHSDVIRVAEASLAQIRTYPQKRDWYNAQIEAATKAMGAVGTTPKPQDK